MDDSSAGPARSAAPPVCEKRPHRLEAHGDVRVDDYFWLNQREDPEVLVKRLLEGHRATISLPDSRHVEAPETIQVCELDVDSAKNVVHDKLQA